MKVAEVLGLSDMLDRRPKALSGGQRQRVAVGRAIVRKPAVFLFDEPLSNLDAKLRVQMRVELSRLHAKLATTMIYVTHDQVEAMTLGERIVVMKDGDMLQADSPLQLYDHPVKQFVAGFIGTPPMNFFKGQLQQRDGVLTFLGSADMTLVVPETHKTFLGAYRDKPITLGIRPEDIGSVSAEQIPDAPRIRATVDVVETMGAESYVHMSLGESVFISRVDAHRRFRLNEKVDVAVDTRKIHFFDAETEDRIGGATDAGGR